ncbi:MAG: hypothetical protein ACI935_000899 [Moritella dasanensis]|jgi:hypothetical protein
MVTKMKNINILSLVQAYNSLGNDNYVDFTNYYGVEIKNKEVEDLEQLIGYLYSTSGDKIIFHQFYVGYKIPQISKEFDLLRFGKDCVINIELKNKSTEEKVKNQLRRNKHYLSHIKDTIYNFSFVVDTRTLYILNSLGEIEIAEPALLIQLLTSQEVEHIGNVDKLFNPSDYLVSPFNSTDKFIDNQYFLTGHQDDVKNKILTRIGNDTIPNLISVTGSAGTGKTLLVYDIVKEIKKIKTALIIHCGYLNEGHEKLKEAGWDIIPIRDIRQGEIANVF